MKNIFFLLVVVATLPAIAQTNDSKALPVINTQGRNGMQGWASDVVDKYGVLEEPKWVLDVNLLGGALVKDITTANSAGNYLNGVNINQGVLKFKNGASFGFDVQLGYFFGEKRHWGIGTGIMYLSQMGDLTLDNYHAEYQSVDYNGNTFRQVVSPNQPIKENIKI